MPDMQTPNEAGSTDKDIGQKAVAGWQDGKTAPKNQPIIAKIKGYPWSTMAVWSEASKAWCVTSHTVGLYEGVWNDDYLEHEYHFGCEIQLWQPMPTVPEGYLP